MIGKLILLAVIIGMRLSYTNLVEPMIKNEIYMSQMTNDSASYILIQSLPYLDKVYFGICLILILLIGVDVYNFLTREKEKEYEEN